MPDSFFQAHCVLFYQKVYSERETSVQALDRQAECFNSCSQGRYNPLFSQDLASSILSHAPAGISFHFHHRIVQYYPMDVQKCHIDLASYAYTTKDIGMGSVNFKTKRCLEYVWKDEEPVQLKAGLSSSLPSFMLRNVSTTYCTSKTNTGAYSCLRTVLELERQFR